MVYKFFIPTHQVYFIWDSVTVGIFMTTDYILKKVLVYIYEKILKNRVNLLVSSFVPITIENVANKRNKF